MKCTGGWKVWTFINDAYLTITAPCLEMQKMKSYIFKKKSAF